MEYSKNILTLMRPTIVVILVSLSLVLLVQGCNKSVSVVNPTTSVEDEKKVLTGEELRKELRNNVVRVHGVLSGFGFIVGQKDGQVYIATADHLVRKDKITPASSVTVNFFSFNNHYPAKLLMDSPSHDLAFLQAKAPEGLSWHHEGMHTTALKPLTDKVWFIGLNDQWEYPKNPGYVKSIEPDNTKIQVTELFVKHGASGAPLIAEFGIAGMLTEDTGNTSYALPIQIINNFAVSIWHYPWQLKQVIMVTVPDLSGLKLNQVDYILKASGLKLGKRVYINTENTQEIVLKQTPEAGGLIHKGKEISIDVSRRRAFSP